MANIAKLPSFYTLDALAFGGELLDHGIAGCSPLFLSV
jgi:hypothetical protein